MSSTSARTRCGVCQSSPDHAHRVTYYEEAESQYFRCTNCGSIVLHPLPGVESNEDFSGHDIAAEMRDTDAMRGRYFAKRLKLLGQSMKTGGTAPLLFEVGCGSGAFLRAARECGWQTEGLEFSNELAQSARALNAGTAIHVGDILQLNNLPWGRADAVAALDVLEHVLSPSDMLERVKRLLKPGGLLLMQTPNADSLRARLTGAQWNMLLPRYHFHLCSQKGLRRLLQDTGFSIITMQTASGTGVERGIQRVAAGMKEILLDTGKWGNAWLVLGKSG